MRMSIQVNDFQHEPGKNDAEYIKLLESSRDEWQKLAQKAITKLKTLSKAQEPRVLTLEEVLKANHPVWFETHDLISPAIIDHGESEAGFCVIVFGEYNWNDYPISQYNKTWRCWTAKPTDEQRAAVKWE